MIEGRSLRRISIGITFDRTYFRKAIEEKNDSDWQAIKEFLSYLGYEVKFVHVTIWPAKPIQTKTNLIHFPGREKQQLAAGRGVPQLSPRA